MTFRASDFNVAVDTIGGGSIRVHGYRALSDDEDVFATGYFTSASKWGLRIGDIIVILRPTGSEIGTVSGIANDSATVSEELLAPVASEVEAVAGVSNDVIMTPLRTVQSVKSREQYLNAKDFGLPDSGGDGTTALRAAIAQSTSENKKLILPKGEWRITGTLDNGVNYSNLHMEGVGKGQTTLLMEVPGLAMFTSTGSYGTVHHLTDELPIGTFTCTVASTAGLTVNGMVRIMDTAQPIIQQQNPPIFYAGQLVRIRSIDSETQFTLWGTAEFDYTVNTSIHPITAPSDLSFRGITIENRQGIAMGLGARGLTFIRSSRVHLEALEFKGIYDDSMTFWTTSDWKVLDVDGLDNISDPTDATPYFILAVRGACHGIINNCFLRRGRHMFDGSAGLEIESAHIVMSNCMATETTEAAIDTHIGIRHFELNNFMATAAARDSLGGNGAPGVQLRGRYCTMKNSKVVGYGFGALLAFGDHCRVIDSEFVDCETGVELYNNPYAELARLKIWRPRLNGIHSYTHGGPGGDINGISIKDIEIYGNPSGAAVNIQNWNDSFHVEKIYAPDATVKFVNVPHQHYYGASKLDTTYFESIPRYLAKDALAALESGKLFLTLVDIERGESIDTLELICAIAPVGQTNLWMSFYDKDLNLLGVTADKLTSAPTNGQKFTFGMTDAVSAPYRGGYYVGIVQVVAGGGAAAMTVRGVTASSEVAGLVPRLSGLSTTGLTNPASAPDPAAEVGASALIPWVGTGSSPASAYLAAMTVRPDQTRSGLIRTLIGDLIGAELWPKIDLIYFMASHDDQASKLNAKNPTSFPLTEFGTVTFTTDQGQKGNGSTGYLTALLFNPTTLGGAYSLDSAVYGVWVREAPTIPASLMYYTGTSQFNKSNTGDTYQARINDVASLNASPTGAGHWSVRRTASNERSIWKDGVSLANDTQVSTVSATAFRLFSTATSAFSDAQLAAAYIGGGFSNDDMVAMDDILRTYFTATGAV